MYPSEDYSALCHTVSAGLCLKQRCISVLFYKIIDQKFKIFFERIHGEFLLIIKLVIGDTVAASEIDKLKIFKLHCYTQEVFNCLKERLGVPKE